MFTRLSWLSDERAFECKKLGMSRYSTTTRRTKRVSPCRKGLGIHPSRPRWRRGMLTPAGAPSSSGGSAISSMLAGATAVVGELRAYGAS